ncbi:MAG: hypothetical protein IJO48_01830 [Clostridia bacterium]|nr:hypothetical protein [Clostridia bacterium]
MKTTLKNTLSIFLVCIIVVSGVAVPLLLLDRDEKDLIGTTNIYMYGTESDGGQLLAWQENRKPSYAEYIKINYLMMYGKTIVAEPQNYEMNMEQAVNKARNEVAQLMEDGIIPKNEEWKSATLSRVEYACFVDVNQSRCGIWFIGFLSEDIDLRIGIEAATGTVMEITLQSTSLPQLDIGGTADAFVDYLGLGEFLYYKDEFESQGWAFIMLEEDMMRISVHLDYKLLTVKAELTPYGKECVDKSTDGNIEKEIQILQ